MRRPRLCGRRRRSEIVVGAGADDLIGLVARTFLAPGRRAAVQRPTYPLYAIASGIEGAETIDARSIPTRSRRRRRLGLQPGEPDRRAASSRQEIAALARALPDAVVAVDEAYFEYGGDDGRPASSRGAEPGRAPEPVEGVRLRGAAGRATRSRRRRSRASSTGGARPRRSRRRPRGSPPPRCASPSSTSRRGRRARADARRAPRRRVRRARPRSRTSSTCRSRMRPSWPTGSKRRGSSSAATRTRYGSRRACRPRTTACSPRSGQPPRPSAVRSALVVRTTAETALRVSLDAGRKAARTRRDRRRLPRPSARRSSRSTGPRPGGARRRRPRRRRAPHRRGRHGGARRRAARGARRPRGG